MTRQPPILTTDANEHSISGILSQDNHPVMHLSRKLTTAESNYSNIEREALAMVWTTNCCLSFFYFEGNSCSHLIIVLLDSVLIYARNFQRLHLQEY